MTALAVILLWAAYLVRDVLLLLYISGLLAIGFSPIVRLIERQQVLPIGTRRFPRWLAILDPLPRDPRHARPRRRRSCSRRSSIRRSSCGTRKDEMFERAQQFLIAKGLLREHLTLQQAVERAPGAGGSRSGRPTVVCAVVGVAGGIFGLLTILILTFYLLVEAGTLRELAAAALSRSAIARASTRPPRDITTKVSAWLGGQLLLAGIIGATSAIGLWLLGIPFFYVLALISAHRRADPDRRADPRGDSRDRRRVHGVAARRCCWS